MQKIITQKYADKLSIRQKLVGKAVEITGKNHDTYIGRVEGEQHLRSFWTEDLEDVEVDSDNVELTFKHFPADKHHKHDSWDLYVAEESFRRALAQENQQIAYVRLDLDWGPRSYHQPQTRRIPKSSLSLLTDRQAAKAYIELHPALFGVADTPAQRQRVSFA